METTGGRDGSRMTTSRGRKVFVLMRIVHTAAALWGLVTLGLGAALLWFMAEEGGVLSAILVGLPLFSGSAAIFWKSIRGRTTGAAALRDRFERMDAYIEACHAGEITRERKILP
jgi:hypothetical protein